VRAREEFLSIASHELKTPITSLFMAVQGVLRLMRKGALASGTSNPAYARLQTIERQSLRLARLVDDLLDVSRINSGQLQLELGEHDLVAVVQDAVARFSTDTSNPKVLLDVRARPPLLGHWDRVRVEQVVTNLLSNAAKYGRGKPIDVVVEATPTLATVCVRDQGIGISQEDVSRIFERFERAPSARGSVMGLGLGLYIVRKILDLHGGAIRVQSSVGVGSTFVIELPRSGPARPLRTEEPPPSDLPPRQEH
jgi:signal transduction histidine kinase